MGELCAKLGVLWRRAGVVPTPPAKTCPRAGPYTGQRAREKGGGGVVMMAGGGPEGGLRGVPIGSAPLNIGAGAYVIHQSPDVDFAHDKSPNGGRAFTIFMVSRLTVMTR